MTDANLVKKSESYWEHSQHQTMLGNILSKGSNYFIVSQSIADMGFNTAAYELAISKYPIDSIYEFGRH
jgi:endonuclease III-like uncharacterized protein